MCEVREEYRHAKSTHPTSRARLRCLVPALRSPRRDVADIERAKDFGESQDLRSAMDKAGVIMPATVRIVP